jgi:hypothetical protein
MFPKPQPVSTWLRYPQFLTLGLVFFAVCLTSLPAWAGFVPPKNLGRPGNRQGAATRDGECGIPDSALKLTALVPISNIGLTTAAQPTFYWFMPRNSYKYQQFRLIRVEAGAETVVYETTTPLKDKSGLQQLRLPITPQTELALDQDYRWDISLICNPADPNSLIYANGWVRRIQPDAGLLTISDQSNLERLNTEYAEAGLWYDTLHLVLEQRQAQPNNPLWQRRWQELTQSEDVQLAGVAKLMGK